MNRELQKIYHDLAAGTLSKAQALAGIRQLKLEERATSVLMASPVWEECAAENIRQAPAGEVQRHVLLCELRDVDAAQLEALLPGSHCISLRTAPQKNIAERFSDYAVACFEKIQALLRDKPAGKIVVQLVIADDPECVVFAGLAALLKTAALEHPSLSGQCVLVSARARPAELAAMLEGNVPTASEALTRQAQGVRQVMRWQEAPAGERAAVAFKDHGVYLVTGGLGGLGAKFAREILVQTTHAKVVLVGRSPLAGGNLALARLHPGRVEYRSVDVCDAQQVEQLIAAIHEAHGQLNGILHCAGSIADNFMLKKQAADFREVLAPKVMGTFNLDQASQQVDLDFLALFSSIAAVMGNAGQADYAAANGFMDQFAAWRNSLVASGHRAGRTVSINWPFWLEGGMTLGTAQRETLRRECGIEPLRTANGLRAFYESLQSPHAQVLVMEGDPARLRRVLISQTLQSEAAPALAPAPTPSAERAPVATDDLLAKTADYLREQFSVLLKLPARRIDPHAGLDRYGIDSILAVDLISRLEKTFGPLSKTLLFEYQTIWALAEYFARAHAAVLSTLFSSPAAAAPMESAPAKPVAGRKVSRFARARGVARPSEDSEAIAIVGLSGRYPQADDVDAFWRNLRSGVDCITEVPASRWDWREYFSDDRTRSGHHFSKWGGFISGVDEFDPIFFNISPREAKNIDPQERLFLQHAWLAIEDAGYTRASLQSPHGKNQAGQVGVYAGAMHSEYQLFGAEASVQGSRMAVSSSFASIANRVSYALNLHGPSLTLDTMCSSSLTAIHIACQDLRQGRTSLAIAGGVNVSIHPNKYLLLSAGQFISGEGHCQSFGEGGDGYIPGEGVGVVILKRLSDAERDGNHIYGVIRGSALNHGGKTNGYTVPNPQAQADVIRQALDAARVDARQVSYIEAHGTGTKLGDPIEITALAQAFRAEAGSAEAGFCAIGSAKSNIGHCESAAGIAGLTKVLLQLKHRLIAPSLHSAKLNPHIDFPSTPFVVNQTLREWPQPEVDGRRVPRIAGLSSFGAGGSNAHLIIEEYPREAVAATEPGESPCIVPLSARTPAQLQQRARDLLAFIGNQQAIELPALAYTLQVGREPMDARLCIVAQSVGELARKLERFLAGDAPIANVFQGVIDRHADLPSFSADLSMAGQDLPKLARSWVGGSDLSWEKLSGGARPRLMSLPGYPFARDRYWLERPANNTVGQTTSVLHPLVHTNTSTLEEHGFASTFRGTETFLREDAARQKVLPALASLEMMRAAIEIVSPQDRKSGFWEFRDIQWGTPVIVNGDPVRMGLRTAPSGVIAVELFTGSAATGEVVHCQAQAAFNRQSAPARLDATQLESTITPLSLGDWRADLMPAIADLVLRLSGPVSIVSAECVRAFADSSNNPRISVRSSAAGLCDIDVFNEAGEICVQIAGLQLQSEGVVETPAPLHIIAPTPARLTAPAEVVSVAPRNRVTVTLSDLAAPEAPPAVATPDGVFSLELADNAMESAVSALERAQQDTSLKVLRLNIGSRFGEGGRSACNLAIETRLLGAIAEFPCPVIAVMRGDVTGAGFLAGSLCDLMVCSEEGRYAFTDAAQQLFPTASEERFFRERFDDVSMDDFLYRSAPLTGRELKGKGWTCRIVPAARIDAEATEVAADLARKSPVALRLLKAHLARELVPLIKALEVVDTAENSVNLEPVAAHSGFVVPASGIDVDVAPGGIAVVRLASTSNNLETLVAGLRNVIEAIDQDAACRAIVLTSEHAGFLPRADRDIEKGAALHLKMLLQNCRLPLIAAFTADAEGLAWLAGLWCDACVYQANGQYSAGGPWTTPWPAQEVASLFVRRLGRSLGEEACLTAERFTGLDLRNRSPRLAVADASEVIPQALRWAGFWSAWSRDTVTAWKRARVSRAGDVLKALPTWQDREEKETAESSPIELRSSAVTLTAHPDGVVVVGMHDREAKNLFSEALISGLKEAFAHIEKTPAYKVVVLTGYDNYFAAGGTKETLLAIHEGKTQFTDERVFQLPMDCTLPVIAAMQGHAIGGGWSFGMFADLVLFSEESRYASPYMGYGFTPGAGATLVFPGKIGYDLARETLLLAREMSGHELKERGLAATVLPRRDVADAALELARRIACRPRGLLKNLKRQWVHALRQAREETLQLEVGMHEHTFVGRADTLAHIHAKFAQVDVRADAGVAASPAPSPSPTASADLELSTVLDSLRQLLAHELHMQPEDINERAQFTDLGLDSITGVTWIRNINERYGTSIEATRIYSYPTLAELGRFVKGEAEKVGTPDVISPAPAPLERVVEKTAGKTITLAPASTGGAHRSLVSRRRSHARQAQRIAVIGMAGQFPKAHDVDEFWANIAAGKDCISEVPRSRWSLDTYYQEGEAVPGKTNSKWLGALQDYDRFDPLFFNISPVEAECMDPQQRVFLQACWHSIENAGYDSQSLSASRCGVFVGCAGGDYHQLPRRNPLSAQDFTGVATSILAARISYLLNLQGPCISFDTACSSSLVAIANACDSLNAGNSDLALAGGVYVGSGPSMHIMTAQAGMLSTDGRCFTFDDRANGFAIGEGVGVLVLKRLADAERDQDHILGVLEGWGVNQDGKTNGITAPNEDSQARLLQSVYEKFGLDPGGIQLIEAHGTGTRLGDPIEIAGLKAAFRSVGGKGQRCALGSVKSNIGHCLTAAGVAGVIKLMLALKHKQLPPTANFTRQNEHIQLAGSPFYVNDRLQDWEVADGQTRRAAVSSFGFSGTNAHIVVAEHAPSARVRPTAVVTQDDKLMVPLSARTAPQLEQKARDLLEFIRAHADVNLVELAYTLQVGRDAMNERVGFLVGTVASLARKLEAYLAGEQGIADVYRGQVKQSRDELKLLANDDEMRESFVARWLAQRKLGKLLEMWAKGLSVDWNALYVAGLPRRIELPGYPFARDRYWIEAPDAQETVRSVVPASVQPEQPATRRWDGLSYIYRWEERLDPVRQLPGAHQSVLIVGDDSFCDFDATIREHYRNRQADVVQIRVADDTAGFESALQSVAKIDALYFLASGRCDELALLRLVKYLKQEHKVTKVDTYILTRDIHSLNEDACQYAGAGSAGLAYSLAQGNYQFQVRNLDLSSGDLGSARGREQLFSIISREPPSDRGEVFRIESGRRFQRAFLKLDWGTPAPAAIKHGGVYLIAGGSGIVGRIFTRYLLEKYRARVVWLGRSAEDSPAVSAAMREFENRGLLYVQADVSNLDSMRRAIGVIRQTHPAIHGAIFSAMVFGTDNSIDQITESQFASVAGVKTRGSEVFHAALASEPLDFLVYLSSGQAYSFSGASRVAAYAAGINFSDSFVRSLRGRATFPVGTINWGAWAAFVKERMQAKDAPATSMGAFEDGEGFECFERFVGALQQGNIRQVLCMRASEDVQALMNCHQDDLVTLAAATPGAAISVETQMEVPHEKIARLKDIRAASQLEEWFAQLLTHQFIRMFEGSGAAPATLAELQKKAGIQAKYMPWVTQALQFLAERNCLDWHDGAIRGWNAKASQAKWQEWQAQRQVYAQDPETRALAVLVNDCLENLPAIMQGKCSATDIIFPNSSMEKVASLYKNNAVADTFNEMVADAALVYLRQRLQADPKTRIRILEIGAGTGGTSAAVFAKLRPFHEAVEEYRYTDLSKAFFLHAEEHYKPANPYIVCQRLDIEQPIEAQGIDLGSYDLVIATNVLHATRDIRRTLRNAKAAMRRNGLLLLNEMSDKSLTTHLTVALLDGWWLFEDPELRIPGCPGLYPDSWRRVLAEEGFGPVQFPAESAHTLGNQIIVARSDGVVRQTAIQAPARAAVKAAREPAAIVAESLPGMSADDFVRGVIRECLSGTLKVASKSIEADSAFSDYGVDSILGVSFVKQLSERLRIPLNTAIIFEYSSMERLSKHIVATYGSGIAAQLNVPAPIAQQAAAVEVKPPVAQVRAELRAPRGAATSGIAVVGMSGRFPKAANVREFWNNLVTRVDGVDELPEDYLQPASFSPRKQKGKTRCKWGGILTERDCFDPLFFNISPREAEAMNPHQRLVMQESWNAIEDAGYNPKTLAGTRTGIFVGSEPTGYAGDTFTGVSEAIIASRLSYVLNLNGPAFVVNTGCSSSGVALHLACESLRNQETDVVLAGGVHACMSQETQIRLDEIEMVSPSGRCFTFDQKGDGTIISEGIGMVVLKRLEDAVAAGDHIYGTIRGSGINQDGASNGITAPNGAAQEQLIRSVYDKFGIDPQNISYIEAHGTGTKLGDPVETNALVRAFRKYTDRQEFCAVGSAKSHIGHTAAAAGVTGLIKVLLSLQHRKLPGLLNFSTLNPLIEFRQSPFFIPTETMEWKPAGGTRMAALNSFGHSGTNVHLVIEEYVPAPRAPRDASNGAYIIPLSARSREQLREKTADLLAFLRASAQPIDLASLAYTLQLGREAMEQRSGYVVSSVAELADALETQVSPVSDASLHKQLDAWIAGASLDWNVFWRGNPPGRVNLPGYPFARERYWAGFVAESSARLPESQPTRESIADIIDRIDDESIDPGEGIKLLRMAV
ncbi:MAG TPA: SDR family NAD(P)-dependent oxidoreductase [Steroidobacteraceae bacterium]|nr:SDR family NAD(P)-dependent oxidoreductase [Steroidobacteraceae bacterium]